LATFLAEAVMPVTGIGGFFFRAKDPAGLALWYRTHLGVGGAHGMWAQAAGTTVFAPFDAGTDYFALDKTWMLNLRVTDLDTMLTGLRAAGIEIITKPEWDTKETGRFARIHDPEGNAIELWQPPHSE
jgi:catechol 2,3-dioxygenase-like lactoylglutathione lyase family enzyme